MKTLAVLTGISTEEDVLRAPEGMSPDFYTASISEVLSAMEN